LEALQLILDDDEVSLVVDVLLIECVLELVDPFLSCRPRKGAATAVAE
jgi:hypothetical protein